MNVKIEDVANVVAGGTPDTSNSAFWNGGIPWITPRDMSELNAKYVSTTTSTISKEGLANSSSKLFPSNSVILSTRAPVGYLAINNVPMASNQGIKAIVCDTSKVSSEFLYYYLKTRVSDLEHAASGSTFKELPTSGLRRFEIEIPSLAIQLRIAGLLGSLDEKIAVCRKNIAELESLIRLVYDRWFVEFEFPDERGCPYKSNGGKMVWSESLKRTIPEGWNCSPLGQQIKSVRTGLNPRDNFTFGGGIRYLTVKNLRTDGLLDFSDCDFIDSAARNLVHARSDISVGDILFASIAPLGRCYLITCPPIDWDINESVFSIRANPETTTPEYLYSFLRSPWFVAKAEQQSTGSIFLGIRVAELQKMLVPCPGIRIINLFSGCVAPMLKQIARIQDEICQTIQMRDWLLPMLMNGQVEVAG